MLFETSLASKRLWKLFVNKVLMKRQLENYRVLKPLVGKSTQRRYEVLAHFSKGQAAFGLQHNTLSIIYGL